MITDVACRLLEEFASSAAIEGTFDGSLFCSMKRSTRSSRHVDTDSRYAHAARGVAIAADRTTITENQELHADRPAPPLAAREGLIVNLQAAGSHSVCIEILDPLVSLAIAVAHGFSPRASRWLMSSITSGSSTMESTT